MSAEPRPAARGDPALGLFETLRVDDGRPRDADAHLARLERSLQTLYGLDAPAGLGARLTARAAPLAGPHRLRVDAVPRGGELQISFSTSPLAPGLPAPVGCTVALVPGGLGPHKLRDRTALDTLTAGPTTPLIADRDGTVLEAAWGNLWLREGDRLITPPADGRLLPGVTRARLFAAAAEPEPGFTFQVVQEPITRERLAAAGAGDVFITSALRLAVAAVIEPALGPEPVSEPPWLATLRESLRSRT